MAMNSLFSEVLEGTFGANFGGTYESNLSAADIAEIDARVTEEAYTMAEYVGECEVGIVACEAALMGVEGRCAVAYLQATSESARADLEIAVENAFTDAFEKVQEWVKKAWEAIKKFVKKCWEKMKGYFALFKNMLSKYGDVIKKKDISGLKVNWAKIDIMAGLTAFMSFSNKMEKELTDNFKNNTKAKAENNRSEADSINVYTRILREEVNKAIYDDVDGIQIKQENASTHLKEAIGIADLGYSKYYQDFIKIGDKKIDSQLKKFKTLKDDIEKAAGDIKDPDKNKERRDEAEAAKKIVRICINWNKYVSSAINTAIAKKYSLAVGLCRAAIRYKGGDTHAGANESADFSSFLAEIM